MDAAVAVAEGSTGEVGVSVIAVGEETSAGAVDVSVWFATGVIGVGVMFGLGGGGAQNVSRIAEQLNSTNSFLLMATSFYNWKVRIHIPMIDLSMCD